MTQIPQAPLQAPVLPERVFSAPAAVSEASSSAFSSLAASDGAATSQTRPSLAAQAGEMEKRLNRLLDKAAGGLPGLSGSLYERIRESVPRPGIFERQGRRFHQAMLDAAVKCDNAAAELAKIPAKSFLFLPLSDEHFQAVKNYTDAQNELYAQIRQFCGSMGSSPCLDSLLQATQFRASEALNLVASMQLVGREEAGLSPEESAIRREIAERLVDTDEQSGTLRGMQAMTPLMHGAVLSATLKNEVNGLFAEIDALEQRRGDIPLDEFKRSASALSAEAERLKGRVDALSNSGLQADMALKETLTGMLARSAARLDTMGKASPEQELGRAISDLLPHVDGNPLSDLHKSAPHPLKDALGYLAAGITSYNTGISSLKSDLESRGISNQEFRARLNSAVDALRTDSARRACVMLHVMNNAHAGRLDSPDGFRRWYFHYTGENLQRSDAKKLLDYARNSSLFQQKETAKLIELISGVAITKPGIMSAELRELGAMHGRIESRSTALRGEYILSALEHHVNLDTLLEASLRGIPADQLEMTAGEGILKADRVLGQGMANTVHLCTYRGEDGEDMRLVFKPEVGARHGLAGLCAAGLGYQDGARIMQLNVAACRAADAIGCGNVIARSRIGTHGGRVGLFMEAAPGKTFWDMATSKSRSVSPLREAISHLQTMGRLDTLRSNLMRELCRLEWADLLSGQVDRHGENYLIDINKDTGEVKVTGIDNDASFGVRKVGMTRVDISGMPDIQRELQAKGVVLPQGQPMIIDGRDFTEEQLMVLRRYFGFNQLFVPTHIDGQTYDMLMAIDENAYRRSLESCMSRDAVDAAMLRLQDAKAHATALQGQGRVVRDWTSDSVLEEIRTDHRGAAGSKQEYLQNGFFSRDFLGYFPAAPARP